MCFAYSFIGACVRQRYKNGKLQVFYFKLDWCDLMLIGVNAWGRPGLPPSSSGILHPCKLPFLWGSRIGKLKRTKGRWGSSSPIRTALGWLQRLTELLRMVLPDTAAVGACPGLVLPANGSESWPTTAQQCRAAGGWKTSRLGDISTKCLHNPFLPVASSGHGPASPEVPGQETPVPLSQASVSFTNPNPVALSKCYRKQKSH